MVIVTDNVSQIQILDETVCVSLSANVLKKGMNPSVLVGEAEPFSFGMETGLEKNFELKSAVLCLKIGLALHPASCEGAG